ncbi:MAG: 23S rRNA (adenine(2503)-C(2))-methyltransferase RlmN [Limisphaerales bacterium]
MSATLETTHLFDLDFEALSRRLESDGVRPVHTQALWKALHRGAPSEIRESDDLPPPVQRWLESHWEADVSIDVPEIVTEIESGDGYTRKLLLKLADGHEIETVVMGYENRFTACLSTQVGCAMGCVFCATGQMGFVRQLRPGEIVAQVHAAQRLLQSRGESGLRNLVLMGMGEPLHNYDPVMQAMKIVADNRGIGIATSRITVSTVGVVPAIERFTREDLPYNLAVSLHATTDEERSALIPINQRWPLKDLLDACRAYSATSGRKVFFGWTLIDRKNDSPEHARQVAELLQGLNAHVNLIRLNPTEGYEGEASETSAADEFSRIIQESGLPCTIRQRRGIDVGAGCGQLRSASQRTRSSS